MAQQINKGDKIEVDGREYTFAGSSKERNVFYDDDERVYVTDSSGKIVPNIYGFGSEDKWIHISDLGKDYSFDNSKGKYSGTYSIDGIKSIDDLNPSGTLSKTSEDSSDKSTQQSSSGEHGGTSGNWSGSSMKFGSESSELDAMNRMANNHDDYFKDKDITKVITGGGDSSLVGKPWALEQVPDNGTYATPGQSLSYSSNPAGNNNSSNNNDNSGLGSYIGGGDGLTVGGNYSYGSSGNWDFTADSEIQEELASSLDKAAENFNSRVEAMYQEIDSMGSNWVGEDYDAFKTGTDGYKNALSDLAKTMNMYASHYRKVATGTDDLAKELIKLVENATTIKG